MNFLGKVMNENGIIVSPQISNNMSSLLETFGIQYNEKVIQVQEKVEQKKSLAKKDSVPKLINLTQKLISFADFEQATQQIKIFDIELSKLGYLKNSPALDE